MVKYRYLPGILWFFLLLGCSQQNTPLRLATNVWPGYEPLYLARDQQFFSSKRIRLIEFSSTTQVLQAFRNKLIDAAGLTLDEALLLLENNADIRIVLVMDISNGADVVIARKGINGLQQLKGKRIGVENNALGAYMVSRLLDIFGLDRDEVKIVQLEVDEHEKAFHEGRVDAVVTFEPVRSRLLKAGAVQIFDSSQIPGEIVDVLVVRKSYMDKNPATIQHLLDGWFKALEMIRQQPRKAAKILGRRMKLNIEDTLASYRGLVLPARVENQHLLQDKDSELKITAKILSHIMLEKKLISRPVNTGRLFE